MSLTEQLVQVSDEVKQLAATAPDIPNRSDEPYRRIFSVSLRDWLQPRSN